MRPSRATLKEVAARAGVSRTTASDALRDGGRVSPETRAKVHRVAHELGYTVNVAAARLRTHALTSIGLYIPSSMTSVSFHMRFTLGAAAGARSEGVDLTLLAYDANHHPIKMPAVDGLMIVEAMQRDPVVDRLQEFALPTLFVGRKPGSHDWGSVISIDHSELMNRALDHLWSIGARRPGLLGPRQDFGSEWSESVLNTYASWCVRHGIEPVQQAVPALPNSAAVEEAVQVLVTESHIDGLIGAHEGSAALAIPALQRLGIEIGREFPVISGVGSEADMHTVPPLTAIDMHPFDFGVDAARHLIERIRDPAGGDGTWAHGATLVLRASTEAHPHRH